MRHALTLSDDKERQELGAITRFAELFNQHTGRRLTDITPLAEDDHDFLANVDSGPVILQLAELVDRTWIRDAPPSGQPFGRIELVLGGFGYHHIDDAAYDDALRALVEMKPLWLVIFTTAAYFLELGGGDQAVITRALFAARNFLNEPPAAIPFDQIWFTNLARGVTQVWPRPSNEPPVEA